MNRFFNKWYMGLFALPVLINLLTNSFNLPDIFKNWQITLITTLTFLSIILIIEMQLCLGKIRKFEFTPKERDKRLIRNLLNILDIDFFHEEIKNQDSWYGFKKEAISKTIYFAQEAGYISNKTSDKKLNQLILNLKNAIDAFNAYSSLQLFENGDNWYSPAKDNDFNIEKTKRAQPIMNAKADLAFNKLTLLLDYLKLKNYLE